MRGEFYKNLDKLESILRDRLNIEVIDNGLILVNGILVDTNQQMEMLTPTFFTTSCIDNQTINLFMHLFQSRGILPKDSPHIPVIRDIPLRSRTVATDSKQQQALFARFLEDYILVNQWSHLFKDTFDALKINLRKFYTNASLLQSAKVKKITHDAEGNPLSSGGYFVTNQSFNGMNMSLHVPDSLLETDISAAIDKSLNATENTITIVKRLKPTLLRHAQIAFNIRGVGKNVSTRDDIQNTDLGGGHQFFFLLDKNTHTLYSINNTIASEDEKRNMQFFKDQIDMFLQSIGDSNVYTLQTISGKSRQPDSEITLNQVCGISQFCHYLAILSGIPVDALHDTVPSKITTLFYLLQYAVIHQNYELLEMLDSLGATLSATTDTQEDNRVEPNAPHHAHTNQSQANLPYFSWLLNVLANVGQYLYTAALIAITGIIQVVTNTSTYVGRFFQPEIPLAFSKPNVASNQL